MMFKNVIKLLVTVEDLRDLNQPPTKQSPNINWAQCRATLLMCTAQRSYHKPKHQLHL